VLDELEEEVEDDEVHVGLLGHVGITSGMLIVGSVNVGNESVGIVGRVMLGREKRPRFSFLPAGLASARTARATVVAAILNFMMPGGVALLGDGPGK